MSEVHKTLPYKEFAQPDASSLKTVTYCLSSGMLPGPACGGHLATGTFFAEDVPTGTCTYHKVQKPADTNGSNGSDGNGSSTDPGDNTTDPGTDPGGGTTDPGGGTTPETPPAEGGRNRDHAPAPTHGNGRLICGKRADPDVSGSAFA